MSDILLQIKDLSIVYATEDGVVQALTQGFPLAQARPPWPAALCV